MSEHGRHLEFSLRMVSTRDAGSVCDRAAFLAFAGRQREYLQANDIWMVPTAPSALPEWLDTRSRVVVAAYDNHGTCVGFSGADNIPLFRRPGEMNAAVIWYAVEPLHQGRGLAVAMAREALMRFQERFRATWIVQLACRESNAASRRVAEALRLLRDPGRDYSGSLAMGVPSYSYIGYEGDMGRALGDLCVQRTDAGASDTSATSATPRRAARLAQPPVQQARQASEGRQFQLFEFQVGESLLAPPARERVAQGM